MSKKHKTYDKEFKIRAVEMLENSGKSLKQTATELGCTVVTLRAWRNKFGRTADESTLDSSTASRDEILAENKRLQKELARVTEQREILKKATAILSR